MEDKYPIKEIKVMEGVYIWKPEKNTNNTQNNTDTIKKKEKISPFINIEDKYSDKNLTRIQP